MAKPAKAFSTGLGAGVVGVLLILLLIAVVTAYSGAYNIAATEDHTPFVRWLFMTTMKNSIERQASGTTSPEPFTNQMIAAGASEYQAMCQHCHGGPGVEKDEWAKGMLPQPPHLPDVVNEWEPNQIFWLVKHGAKMTGMPAFGPTHDDAVLWDIVAFVSQLPAMTNEEYTELTSSNSSDQNQDHSHSTR